MESWPPIKNGQDVFFSQAAFEAYSMQPSFIQQLVTKESELAKFQEEHGQHKDKKPGSPEQAKEQKASNSGDGRSSVVSGATNLMKELEASLSTSQPVQQKTPPWWKLPVLFPRPSLLTRDEQRCYLTLYQKFQHYTPLQATAEEMKLVTQFRDLQMKVIPEQEEFLHFMETVVTTCHQSYESLNPNAGQYMQEYLELKKRRVQKYPRYYVQHESASLVPPTQLYHMPLVHQQQLLHLGCVTKAIVPKMDNTNPADVLKVNLDYSTVCKQYPVEPMSDPPANKQVCSEDVTCETLARKHQADIVISAAGLKCLLDNQPGLYSRQWELPVIVREYTCTDDGVSKKVKVVYVDKPFAPKSLLAREKNAQYYKFALKAMFLHPNDKGSVDLTTWKWQHKLAEDTTEVTSSERKTVTPSEDFFNTGTAVDIDDLETFGVSKPKSKQQGKGPTTILKSTGSRQCKTKTVELHPTKAVERPATSVLSASGEKIKASEAASNSADLKIQETAGQKKSNGQAKPSNSDSIIGAKPAKPNDATAEACRPGHVQTDPKDTESHNVKLSEQKTQQQQQQHSEWGILDSDSESDDALVIDTESDDGGTKQSDDTEDHSADCNTSVSTRRMSLRPRKQSSTTAASPSAREKRDRFVKSKEVDEMEDTAPVPKRKRGRPPKVKKEDNVDLVDLEDPIPVKSASRRLPKYVDDEELDCQSTETKQTASDKPSQEASAPDPDVIRFEEDPASPEPEAQAGEDIDLGSTFDESDASDFNVERSSQSQDGAPPTVKRKRGRPPKVIKLERDQTSSEETDSSVTAPSVSAPGYAVSAETLPLIGVKATEENHIPVKRATKASIAGKSQSSTISVETAGTRRRQTRSQSASTSGSSSLIDQLLQDQNKMFEPVTGLQTIGSPPKPGTGQLTPGPAHLNLTPAECTKPAEIHVPAPSQQEQTAKITETTATKSEQKFVEETEWQMTEDPTDHPAPSANVTYNLWSLGNLRLLVRCGYHGNQKHHRKACKFVMVSPKLEYLPQYGGEQVPYSEGARDWVAVHFRHQCELVRARINVNTAEIIMLERLGTDRVVTPRSAFNPGVGAIVLHGILNQLHGLRAGHYLLSHTPGSPHTTIKKTTTSTRGVYDLHMAYLGNDTQSHPPTMPPWVPIDPSVILPYHRRYGRVPATFEPRDSPLNNTVRQQNPLGKKYQHKQKQQPKQQQKQTVQQQTAQGQSKKSRRKRRGRPKK